MVIVIGSRSVSRRVPIGSARQPQTHTDGSDENGATTGNLSAHQFGVQDWSTNEVEFGQRWYRGPLLVCSWPKLAQSL